VLSISSITRGDESMVSALMISLPIEHGEAGEVAFLRHEFCIEGVQAGGQSYYTLPKGRQEVNFYRLVDAILFCVLHRISGRCFCKRFGPYESMLFKLQYS
jgi:hypothetical protein